MKKDMLLCVAMAGLSLVIAAAGHRFFPGFGMAFKPLLWPLAVLALGVRPAYAVGTAFAVPYLSCLITGMPTLPVAVHLSLCAAGAVLVLALVRVFVARSFGLARR